MSDLTKPAILGGTPVIGLGRHHAWPALTDDDRRAVAGVLERGVLSGPFAPEAVALQDEFAQFVGVNHCLLTHSGTSALHMAVAAAGIGPGDEVITTAFTFIATALAIIQHQAVPVFVDIDPATFNLDPALVEKAITPRTKAIMPVHIHGLPANMNALRDIAKRHNLVVIEDAAQAHGATFEGQNAGSMGQSAGFSLQSSKNLAAGEGGLFVTDDAKIAERANQLRNFGENIKPSDYEAFDPRRPLDERRAYDSVTVGFMYRGNEMMAALCRSRLKRLPEDTARVIRNAERLIAGLMEFPGITAQFVPPGSQSVWHKFRIRLDAQAAGVAELLPEDNPAAFRECLRATLIADGIEAVLWATAPVPAQGVFKSRVGFGKGLPWSAPGSAEVNYDLAQYPETQKLLDHSLLLFSQSHPLIAQTDDVIDAYISAFRKVWDNLPTIVTDWRDKKRTAATATTSAAK